jgi:SAM-dependent methyltransferase
MSRQRPRTAASVAAIAPAALAASRTTISSYEQFAADYDKLCDDDPPPALRDTLRRMLALLPARSTILEIGSGPGRDADFVESLGARVRRTDATQAFLDIQKRRGKHGELLNALTDEIGGPYDGVLALCTLIHIDREHTDFVLSKIARATRPDGAFLVSMREGNGETTGDYQMTYWSHAAFAMRLERAGFGIESSERRTDSGGDVWMTFLCRRVG